MLEQVCPLNLSADQQVDLSFPELLELCCGKESH
jgi:hypothetical protein